MDKEITPEVVLHIDILSVDFPLIDDEGIAKNLHISIQDVKAYKQAITCAKNGNPITASVCKEVFTEYCILKGIGLPNYIGGKPYNRFIERPEKRRRKEPAMDEITISLDRYNDLFGKAMSFDKIVEAVKNNIDKNDIYPVDSDEIMLLTGLTKYKEEHFRAMANSAEVKMITSLKETIEAQKTQIAMLYERIDQLQMKPEPDPEEKESHAEDQTEL